MDSHRRSTQLERVADGGGRMTRSCGPRARRRSDIVDSKTPWHIAFLSYDAASRVGPFCDSIGAIGEGLEPLPDDIEMLKAALIVAREQAATARVQSDDQALNAYLKLQIEKLNRDRHGPRSERTARLLDQLELTLEELESSATEDELSAEMAAERDGRSKRRRHGRRDLIARAYFARQRRLSD